MPEGLGTAESDHLVPCVARFGRRIVLSRVALEEWLANGAPTDD